MHSAFPAPRPTRASISTALRTLLVTAAPRGCVGTSRPAYGFYLSHPHPKGNPL